MSEPIKVKVTRRSEFRIYDEVCDFDHTAYLGEFYKIFPAIKNWQENLKEELKSKYKDSGVRRATRTPPLGTSITVEARGYYSDTFWEKVYASECAKRKQHQAATSEGEIQPTKEARLLDGPSNQD